VRKLAVKKRIDPERFRQVEKIFNQVLEKEEGVRGLFLEKACGVDTELKRQVKALLASHAKADGFIEQPAYRFADGLFGDRVGLLSAGSLFGSYCIVQVIDSGGMGTVYEAEQEEPRRRVALKVLHPILSSHQVLKRFKREAQILALLSHSGIAQIYEAGTHGEGEGSMPYFAMEFIPNAQPITDYARRYRLDIPTKLELFLKVLDAVSHGHLCGIVHRDLKPDNILVDSICKTGSPKVIDFGVARVIDPNLSMPTLHTAADQFVGTLRYMSPEQCMGDHGKVGVQSDVYSLGMVLYELLCERLPYDVKDKAITQIMQVIQEGPPERPSKLNPVLSGDLETLTLKALEKDPLRRYPTAEAFAQDIRRYLEHEPIHARPPSLTYKIGLFCNRASDRAVCRHHREHGIRDQGARKDARIDCANPRSRGDHPVSEGYPVFRQTRSRYGPRPHGARGTGQGLPTYRDGSVWTAQAGRADQAHPG